MLKTFILQLKLGYQIMKMADKLTDNPTEFTLYWTDLSYENIAVDKQGYVRLVDSENIIVVDKWQIKQGKNVWEKLDICKYIVLVSLSEEGGFTFSQACYFFYSWGIKWNL